MLLFADHALPFMVASYALTGRFNPQHELEEHPNAEAADVEQEIRQAKSQKDDSHKAELEAVVSRESAQLVGTTKAWKQYREEFGSLANEAISREIIPNDDFLGRLFKYLDRAGTLSVDANGALWLEISEGGNPSKLGLSASNLFASGTDSQWAYAITLARASHYLKSPKHSREVMTEFKNDWAVAWAARVNSLAYTAGGGSAPSTTTRAAAVSPARNHNLRIYPAFMWVL
jgi:hypothetical protein